MQLDGTTAIVTGGASGLGLATVAALARAGARVIAIDLPGANTCPLTELGERVEFAPTDVADADAVGEAVDRANTDRSLRVVVNCAGIGNAVKTVGQERTVPRTNRSTGSVA
jgi:NAD(P)-dependent dehydrogenase (short-subunit alcohol dehydrogenase family)